MTYVANPHLYLQENLNLQSYVNSYQHELLSYNIWVYKTAHLQRRFRDPYLTSALFVQVQFVIVHVRVYHSKIKWNGRLKSKCSSVGHFRTPCCIRRCESSPEVSLSVLLQIFKVLDTSFSLPGVGILNWLFKILIY